MAAIAASSEQEKAEKRFDMPGFRPNDYHIYQMRRYGIVPEAVDPDTVNGYESDRAYWASFLYTPAPE